MDMRERLKHTVLTHASQIFNTVQIHILELGNFMAVTLMIAITAVMRRKIRGAHSREDYPKRNDQHWLKYIIAFSD